MAVTSSINYRISDGVTSIVVTASESVGATVTVDESVATGETNKQVTASVPSSGLKTFTITSDQDVTIKTNSSGSPQETFTIKANKPLAWITGGGGGQASPIAGPVTALFVTNSSGSAARIQLLAGYDPTP
jgi:hypothetical protein